MREGYTRTDAPSVAGMLPWRFPWIIREEATELFVKEQVQVWMISTTCHPRCREPFRPRIFVLLSATLGEDPKLAQISGALREPAEAASVVDLLQYESYPSLAPLDHCMVFASDLESAKHLLGATDLRKNYPTAGSLIVHGGRLYVQLVIKD